MRTLFMVTFSFDNGVECGIYSRYAYAESQAQVREMFHKSLRRTKNTTGDIISIEPWEYNMFINFSDNGGNFVL